MQVSKNAYLLVASCEIKHHLYSGLEVIKACGKDGFTLSRRHFISGEGGQHLLWGARIKNKEQKLTAPAHSEQKALVVFPPKILLRIVCLFNFLV
jgi:hypothetical protein